MARSGQASVDVVADFTKFAAQFQKDLNLALRGIKIDMSNVSNQISNGVREGVNAANDELKRLGNQAGESFNIISKKSSDTGRSMAASFASAGREMSDVGDQMSLALTLPIVAAGTATINSAGNFEAAMNKVKAATESSGEEFTKLRNLAIDLGSTTAFSASEAAFAMNELATAGFDTTEIMGALPGVLDMAAAGSVSLSQAAEISAAILNGFGFAATDLTGVNDILARTFLSTATTLTDLGESFKYVGPIAKSAGLSFTETAAAIGLMGNAGIRGSMAGTALNSSISRLLKPTKEVENTLRELGVTVTNSSGKILPLVDILRQLEQSGADTTDMIALFGLEAGPDMQALLSQGSVALAELDAELKNAGGTASKVAKTQMAGFNGAMDELSSSAEGLMIAIGDAGLLGWMTSLAKQLTKLTASVSKLNPEFLKVATVIGFVVAAVGPALAIFGRMATAIGEGILAFKKFGAWILRVAPWLSTLTGPVGWVVAAIVALAIAAVVAYNKIDAFRNVVDRAFRMVAAAAVWMWQNAIMPAFNWIVAKATVLGTALVKLWNQAQPVFTALGAAVMRVWNSAIKPGLVSIAGSFLTAGAAIRAFWTTTVQPALTQVMALFGRLATAVRSWWEGNGDSVMQTAASVVTWLGGVLTTVFSGVMAVLRAVAAVISWIVVNVAVPLFTALVSVIRTIVTTVMGMEAVWTVVGAIVGAAVAVIAGVVKVLWAVITTAFTAIAAIVRWLWTTVIVPAFTAIGAVIKVAVGVIMWMWTSVVSPVFQAIGAAVNVVASVLIWLWTSVVSPVFQAIGAVISWVWSSIIQPAFSLIATAVGLVVSAITWLWNTFSPIFAAIGNLIWTVWSGVISVVFSLLKLGFSVIVAVVQVFWAVIKTAFMAVAAVVMMVWSSVISPLLSAIGALFTWLWGIIQSALAAIGDFFVSLWTSKIQPVINFISAGFSWLWGVIQTIFNAVVGFIAAAIAKIVAVASGVAGFVNSISTHFQSAVNAVRDKIGAVVDFVRGLPGKIMSAIGNLGSLLYDAGQNVINGLINGIASRIGALRDKMASAASAIRDHLPFSPAKEGPLSGPGDPTKSGSKIISMVAMGMEAELNGLRTMAETMSNTIALSLTPTATALAPLATTQMLTAAPALALGAPTTATAGAGTSATTITYQITVNSIDPKSASTAVIDAIREYERRNGLGWRS